MTATPVAQETCMSTDTKPPSRWPLLLPLLLWGLLTFVGIASLPLSSGPQLFLGPIDQGTWIPWSYVVPPIFLGLLTTMALWFRRFTPYRRRGLWISTAASLSCLAFVVMGLSWVSPAFGPKGSVREVSDFTPEGTKSLEDPLLVDLGQGLRLAYSPVVPADSSGCTLPHRVTPPLEKPGVDVEGPLNQQSLSNLVAFTRAYGHLRWFHPTDAARQSNWDNLAVLAMPTMASARDAMELRERLMTFFASFAPTAQFLASSEIPKPVALPQGATRQARWIHRGAYGISMDIRAAAGPPRASRLAAVAVAWNLLRHFSPYLETVAMDWERALEDGLRDAATAGDDATFLHTFRTFMSRFRDGHIWPRMPKDMSRNFSLPFSVAHAEGRAFVLRVAPHQDARLTPGCEILSVEGESGEARLARIASEASGVSPGHRIVASEMMFGGVAKEGATRLRWRTPMGQVVETDVNAGKMFMAPRDPKNTVREITPGIVYVDVTLPNPDPKATLARLAQAKGILIDVRGYPGEGFLEAFLLPHLATGPMRYAPFHLPQVSSPDRSTWVWKPQVRSVIVPKGKRIQAPVVFLVDAGAQSYAETLLSLVEHYKLGTLVGEPSTGTNGNVATVRLPGGVEFNWTPLRVLRHDGSRFHQVGIRPTVPVSRTVKGLMEGRDEALERAVALLQGH